MYSKYHVKADELSSKFLESIKTLFKGREIEIIIHDFDEKNHLREYISEINDGLQWNEAFNRPQKKIIQAARKAKKEIKMGKSATMNFNKL